MKIHQKLKKSGVVLPERVVQRNIISEIAPWIDREEIIVLLGARQTGKTVLLFQIIYDILLKKTNRIHYFNLDIADNLKKIHHPDYLIDLATGSKKKTYIFIDEIQRIRESGLFLKGLYDLHLPLKFIVSGSSALEIKGKVNEALTGRKQVFYISPFNFEEIARAIYPQKHFPDLCSDINSFKKIFNHFITYGAYPAVVMAKSKNIKLKILKEIFSSYIEKDVKSYLDVENDSAYMTLVKILSSQIGNLLNKNELSNSIGIHKNTLDKYLHYLEQTYIIDYVRPFFRNPRKELLKSPKVYFNDMGLRNYAIGTIDNNEFSPDRGAIFENFIYIILKEKYDEFISINYWRTKAGAEVDFILNKQLKIVPVEVKAGPLKKPQIGKGFRSFLQTYKPGHGYYVNNENNGTAEIDENTIRFITPEKFVLEKII